MNYLIRPVFSKLHNLSLRITRSTFNVEKQEYLCPICQRLSNSVLPIATNLTRNISAKPPSRKTFTLWLKELETIISQNIERKKPSKIQDNFEEVDNLVLNYKIDLDSLMTKRFDGNFVDMTTNFAVNCVTVKYYLDFFHPCISTVSFLDGDNSFSNSKTISQIEFPYRIENSSNHSRSGRAEKPFADH